MTLKAVDRPAVAGLMSASDCERRSSAVTPPLARRTSGLPRVLFLTHRVPCPPDKGDRIRSYNLLRYLAQRADVCLGCLADEPWSEETARTIDSLTEDACITPIGFSRKVYGGVSLLAGRSITEGWFHSRRLVRWIDQAARKRPFDAVVTFCSGMAPYANRPGVLRTPLIVDLVDVDSEKWLQFSRAGSGPRNWLYGLEGARLRRLERRLGDRAAAVTLVSREEADLYRQIAPAANTVAVGNGVDFAYFRRPADAPRQPNAVVFLGALDYRPNIDGIRWFCREVWPSIRERYPAATLRIVGRRPTSAVRGLAEVAGVSVHADVPDVRPYLFEATVAVAPLEVARGVQNKVLEAMACETPVIASSQALEGISAVAGREALSADLATEWSDQIAHVFDDPALAGRLALAARNHVETQFDWGAQLAPLGQLLDEFGSSMREGV